MERAPIVDTDLYFKGTILPKTVSSNHLVDLENGFVLSDERKENIKNFSAQDIYNSIKQQKPELLKSLLNIDIENFDKKEFTKLLEKDNILKPSRTEITKFDNKILNIIFDSLKNTLKTIFYKQSKLFISNSEIAIKDENLCLGWFRSNIFEIYLFADTTSSTFIDYFITGHSNTLKRDIDQSVLNEYKKLLVIWKEKFMKEIDTKIDIGVSTINKSIAQKHFSKNPKYYILEIDLNDNKKEQKTLQLYVTLKKAKNA